MKNPETLHTEKLCHTLARHLSTRECCRKEEYLLCIQNGTVVFSPAVGVYPNRYTRAEADRIPVIKHVLKFHFPDCSLKVNKSGTLTVDPDYFVDGIYRYRVSIDKKSRKWFRV